MFAGRSISPAPKPRVYVRACGLVMICVGMHLRAVRKCAEAGGKEVRRRRKGKEGAQRRLNVEIGRGSVMWWPGTWVSGG